MYFAVMFDKCRIVCKWTRDMFDMHVCINGTVKRKVSNLPCLSFQSQLYCFWVHVCERVRFAAAALPALCWGVVQVNKYHNRSTYKWRARCQHPIYFFLVCGKKVVAKHHETIYFDTFYDRMWCTMQALKQAALQRVVSLPFTGVQFDRN